MKVKKILATAMAAVMAVTMLPTTAKADIITGGGVYLDMEVYKVVLPTTSSMKFYLDPQGLTTLDNTNGTVGASAGTVVANQQSMSAVNKSSVPVGLKVGYKVITTSGSAIQVVDTVNAPADVQDATDNTVAISVEASTDTSTYTGGKAWTASSGTATVDTTSGGAITADVVYAGGTTENNAYYLMSEATYKAKYNGGADGDKYDSKNYSFNYEANTGSELKLKIGGYCSKTTDWSAIAKGTETISLEAVFTFVKTTTAGTDVTLDESASVGTIQHSDGTTDVSFTYTGAWVAGSIKIKNQGGQTFTPPARDFGPEGYVRDEATSTVTIKAPLLKTWKGLASSSGWGPGTYTIILNDVETDFVID